MSRRDGRDSDSRRHSSGFDRELRSRRDGKPGTERVPRNGDVGEHADRDQKQRRRLQDAVPLEAQETPDSKVGNEDVGMHPEKKHDALDHEGVKRSSHPTEVPRSRSYFQHDERGNAAQVGRSFGHRAAPERGWWRDSRDHHDERAAKRYDKRQRDEKPEGKEDDEGNWRHDRFFETEANPPPPPPPPPAARKRPAFREKKTAGDSENADKASIEPEKVSRFHQPVSLSERREDRDQNPRHSDRHERPSAADRVLNRGEVQRSEFSSRERHGRGGGGDDNFRERDRFTGRQGGFRSSGTRAEKWKHDLFDEASKSPPRKNEEDQIAKVEALLAS
ncbi:hypothetical protein SLE2022_259290 [Rubroshorea leprosula]